MFWADHQYWQGWYHHGNCCWQSIWEMIDVTHAAFGCNFFKAVAMTCVIDGLCFLPRHLIGCWASRASQDRKLSTRYEVCMAEILLDRVCLTEWGFVPSFNLGINHSEYSIRGCSLLIVGVYLPRHHTYVHYCCIISHWSAFWDTVISLRHLIEFSKWWKHLKNRIEHRLDSCQHIS